MAHSCDAAIVCCIDFRFQKYLRDWTNKNLIHRGFDLIGLAGSTKDLKTISGQIGISVKLHQIKRVVLIHHEDCGAYGAEGTFDRHVQDLKKARLYYLQLDGNCKEL